MKEIKQEKMMVFTIIIIYLLEEKTDTAAENIYMNNNMLRHNDKAFAGQTSSYGDVDG